MNVPEDESILSHLRMQKGLGVGRMVHWVDDGGHCLAAVVSKVLDRDKGLIVCHVLFPILTEEIKPVTAERAVYDEKSSPRSWHWPEYVP